MIYRGTDFTERINMSPMDRMNSTQWIEMRRFAASHKLEVFLCDDYGNRRKVWSWWFNLDKPMTYEQIKHNIMENMFECDTMEELAETLDDVFNDGFADVLFDYDESEEDECNCDTCDFCGCCEEVKNYEGHHDPEYIRTLKLGKDGDVWVDIMDSGDMWEAWLYRKNMGVKDYMFGWPKVQHADTDEETYYDLDDFIDLVCGNAREHLKFYDEQYGD